MNKIQSQTLCAVTETHFQFKKHFPDKESLLIEDIKKVLECSEAMAEKFAGTHCNMESFWALNYSQSRTNMIYADFFENMLENNFCNKEGRIKVEKNIVCDEIFGFDFKIEYFEDYEDVLKPLVRLDPSCGYQIKIKADTSGFHFMAAYIDVETGLLMGVDTSYRGIPFVMATKVNPKNFIWLLKV
jgi:hypothetical protein